MENFKYQLAKKGKKICPACERKSYVLYIDTMTGEPLHSTVGKCDRADNCGHHYTPKQYFTDNNMTFDKKEYSRPLLMTPKPQPSYIDADVFKKSLKSYDQNNLITYLCSIVGDEAAGKAIQRYFIGTSKHWEKSTVFWQIDATGKVRAGKIMQYDPLTGKRVKKPINRITWVHSAMKLSEFNLSQCLFGEHLLKDNKPVAIVESEKTAIIASCYVPSFIWLACGGCGNLNITRCKPLKGKKVVLFPDNGKSAEWSEKARELSTICSVSVSNILEREGVETGADIADYLQGYTVEFEPFHEQLAAVEPQEKTAIPDFVPDMPLVSRYGAVYVPHGDTCDLWGTVKDYQDKEEFRTIPIEFVGFQYVTELKIKI